MNLIKQPRIQLLIILFFTVFAYINIFQNQFVADDKVFILVWDGIKNIDMSKLLQGSVPPGHEGVYRPLRGALYGMYYQAWGTNPFGYHLHSLLVHLLSTLLVYLIIERITKSRFVSFASGLMFGLHPIHTESITYIAASMEMTGVVFFLASFYLYLRNKLFLSVIFALLAFFTYEMTLTLPILLALYELCYKKLNSRNYISRIKIYASFWLGAFVYGFVRVALIHATTRGPYLADSFFLTILTMPKVVLKYIELLLLPLSQANNHVISKGIEAFVYRGYRTEAIKAQSLFDGQILLGLVVVFVLLFIAFRAWKKWPLLTFGIGWFFISLLPVLEIIPQGSMLNEKMLYIPSFGFVMVLVGFWDRVFRSQNYSLKFKRLAISLLCALVGSSYLYLTFNRNQDWKDELELWSKDVKVYPADNAYAYFQLGNYYYARGDIDKAVSNYERAFEINPHFSVAAGSIARAYQKNGKMELAIQNYKDAIKADPSFWEGSLNLANIYLEKEWLQTSYSKDFSFSYPSGWSVNKIENGVVIEDGITKVELIKDKRSAALSIDDYIKKTRQEDFGEITNQGLAQIPGVDFAYVKIWNDKGISRHQFFLFNLDKVVNVSVRPSSDPATMRVFDRILGSVKF